MNVTGLLRVDVETDEVRSPGGLVPFLELSIYFLVFLPLTDLGVIMYEF